MAKFDVRVKIVVRVRAAAEDTAKRLVMTLMDNHLMDILDNPLVVRAGVPRERNNPLVVAVLSEDEDDGEEE